IEVFHEHEVEGEILKARLLENRARPVGIVRLLPEGRVADEPRRDRAHHRTGVAEQQFLDDRVAVDGERDGLADAWILASLTRELEVPTLCLDSGRVEHLDAGRRLERG